MTSCFPTRYTLLLTLCRPGYHIPDISRSGKPQKWGALYPHLELLYSNTRGVHRISHQLGDDYLQRCLDFSAKDTSSSTSSWYKVSFHYRLTWRLYVARYTTRSLREDRRETILMSCNLSIGRTGVGEKKQLCDKNANVKSKPR